MSDAKPYDTEAEVTKGADSFLAKDCPCCGHKMGYHGPSGCVVQDAPKDTGRYGNANEAKRCLCLVRVRHPGHNE